MTALLAPQQRTINQYVDKITTVDRIEYKDRKVVVEKPKYKIVPKIKERIVYVDRPVVQERLLQTEVPFFVDKIVEKPVEHIVEVPETYEVKKEVERKVERVVEQPMPVDAPKVVERTIEKVVEEVVQVPVDREVKKEVMVDKIVWKDKQNFVDRVVVVGTKVEAKKIYHDKYYNAPMAPRVVVVADDPETRRGGNVTMGQSAVHLPGDADTRERVLWEGPVQDKGAYRAVGDMPKDAFGGVKYTTYEALPKQPESGISKDAQILAVGSSATAALELAASLPPLPSPKVIKDDTKDIKPIDPELEKKLNSLPPAPPLQPSGLPSSFPGSFGAQPFGASFPGASFPSRGVNMPSFGAAPNVFGSSYQPQGFGGFRRF